MNQPATQLTTERKIAERIDTGITSQLAISDRAGGIAFVSMSEVMEFAKLMAISGVAVPKHLRGSPGACLAVCIQALEWQMSPYAVANKSYSVNDRLSYEAQLVEAVILRRAPIKGRFKIEFTGEGDNRVCKVKAELRDEPGEWVEYESPKFGKITPKNSPLWKSDPDQQHFYFSARAFCRRHFPDVLLGVYARDEIDDNPPPPAAAIGIARRPASATQALDAFAQSETVIDVNQPAQDGDQQGAEEVIDQETGEIITKASPQTFGELLLKADKNPPKTLEQFRGLMVLLVDEARAIGGPEGAKLLSDFWGGALARRLRNAAGLTKEDTDAIAAELKAVMEGK